MSGWTPTPCSHPTPTGAGPVRRSSFFRSSNEPSTSEDLLKHHLLPLIGVDWTGPPVQYGVYGCTPAQALRAALLCPVGSGLLVVRHVPRAGRSLRTQQRDEVAASSDKAASAGQG